MFVWLYAHKEVCREEDEGSQRKRRRGRKMEMMETEMNPSL